MKTTTVPLDTFGRPCDFSDRDAAEFDAIVGGLGLNLDPDNMTYEEVVSPVFPAMTEQLPMVAVSQPVRIPRQRQAHRAPAKPRMRRRVSRKFIAIALLVAIAIVTAGAVFLQSGTTVTGNAPESGAIALAPAPVVPVTAPPVAPEAQPDRKLASVGAPVGGPGNAASADAAGEGSSHGQPGPGAAPAGNEVAQPSGDPSVSSRGTSPTTTPGPVNQVGTGPVDGTHVAVPVNKSTSPVVTKPVNDGGSVSTAPVKKPAPVVEVDNSSAGRSSSPVVSDADHGLTAEDDATPSVHGDGTDKDFTKGPVD